MDEADARLLQLLERDARASTTALAAALGLSRSAVGERLKRLQADGAIARFTIERGRPAADSGFEALLFLKIGVRPCDPVIRRFRDWPEVETVWSVGGEIDAVVRTRTPDPAALSRLGDRLARVPGIAAVTSYPVLRRY